VVIAHKVRFGTSPLNQVGEYSQTIFSTALALLWLAALSIFQARSPKILGVGLEEYRRVISATFWLFGVIAIASLAFKFEPSRAYLAVALPGGTIGMLLARWSWRRHMMRRRATGDCHNPMIVIGDRAAVVALVDDLIESGDHFFEVVGVGIYGHQQEGEILEVGGIEVPVLGDEVHALAAARAGGANTVALTGTERFGSRGIRNLLWELEAHDVDLVVAPNTSRLTMQPLPGYPLLHVERPHYREAKRFNKRAFDVFFALIALLLASPLLLIAAIAVKVTSRGPVFYAADRVGLDGQPFTMFKLRTMVENADAMVGDLSKHNESEGGILFKIREDPRITPVGRVLRRFSIDEIPQFLNVMKGDMSVVGPRPPLPREVLNYDGELRRRLLVRPGVTGLWQISGRSDLSWDQSVRLDLSYVENWTMGTDLVIIIRTVRAVLGRDGAY
jgi:exopolysaccharide biosynthesis polyprenyl glycosylphosphotransferase